MLTYDSYHMKFVARNLQQLMTKKPVKAEVVTLPTDSLIHHLSDNPSEYGIRLAHPLLVNDTLPIRVSHVDELTVEEGKPRKKTLNQNKLLASYFKERPNLFSRLKKIDRAMKESRAVVVFDYSILPHKYMYPKTKTSFLSEFSNILKTKIAKIEEVGDRKNQFLCFRLPEVLPDIALFKSTPDPIPSGKLKKWEDDESLGLLYLWHAMENIPNISKEIAKNVTLVFHDADNITQVNLGNLLEWAGEDYKKTQFALYKGWNNLLETRTVADTETLEDVPETVMEVTESSDITDRTLNETMSDLVAAGKLSTAEQNRLWTISKSYKTIENPFGEGSLEDLVTIEPEVLKISSKNHNLPEKEYMVDKGMSSSTITDFTKNYVTEVLEKDVAATVLSIQNAGVLVKDYKVERKIDAINKYNEYSVSLVPVNGKPSTLKFKLPVVEENGEMVANGVRYRMDNQKSD